MRGGGIGARSGIRARGVLWCGRRSRGRYDVSLPTPIADYRTPLGVEKLLVSTSLVRSIMFLAPLVRSLAAMVLTAPERTVKISSIRVPRVRQEANGTVAAVDRTACQTGIITQDRIERSLILTNKRTSAIILMPIRAKRKEFPGGYDKNARFSVKMLSVFDTPSSYELDAHASRSRARFFYASAQELLRDAATTGPFHSDDLGSLTYLPVGTSPVSANSRYWERRTRSGTSRIEEANYFIFQVVGLFSRASPGQKS